MTEITAIVAPPPMVSETPSTLCVHTSVCLAVCIHKPNELCVCIVRVHRPCVYIRKVTWPWQAEAGLVRRTGRGKKGRPPFTAASTVALNHWRPPNITTTTSTTATQSASSPNAQPSLPFTPQLAAFQQTPVPLPPAFCLSPRLYPTTLLSPPAPNINAASPGTPERAFRCQKLLRKHQANEGQIRYANSS